MNVSRKSVLSIVYPLSAALASAVSLESPEITLREQLGEGYGKEIIRVPFSSSVASVPMVVQLNVEGGTVPAQVSDLVIGEDGAKGILTFVSAGLAPLSSQTYTLPLAQPAMMWIAPSQADGVIALETATAGVRIAVPSLGQAPEALSGNSVRLVDAVTLNPPVPFGSLPPFVAGVRLGSEWVSGCAMAGDDLVSGWKVEVAESGFVFNRVKVTYDFEEGSPLVFTVTLFAGDNTLRWAVESETHRPTCLVTLDVGRVGAVSEVTLPKGYGQWERNGRTVTDGAVVSLAPKSSMVNIASGTRSASTVIVNGAAGDIAFSSLYPALWTPEQAQQTFGGFPRMTLPDIPASWWNWKRGMMPISYANGTASIAIPVAPGNRHWIVSSGSAPEYGSLLDIRKDYILDWADDASRPRPRLFVKPADIAAAWRDAANDGELGRNITAALYWAENVPLWSAVPGTERTPENVAATVARLNRYLDYMGDFDVMRYGIGAAGLYDAFIDEPGLYSPQDRAVAKAKLGLLAYTLADPMCWGVERGYHTGNPNMTFSYVLTLGIVACLIDEHPEAAGWRDYAIRWLEHGLATHVGENGEWLVEGSHYNVVSLEPLLAFSVALKNGGYKDFSTNEQFQKLFLYHAKHLTPPDPQRRGKRGATAFGRGGANESFGHYGVAAVFFRDANPELSRLLRWAHEASHGNNYMGDARLAGYEPYYRHTAAVAPQAPQWTSEAFPAVNLMLRHAFGTPDESLVNVIYADYQQNLDIWVPEIGSVAQWYGNGAPLSTLFTFNHCYGEHHELLTSRVRLARNWGAPEDAKAPFGYRHTIANEATVLHAAADYVRNQLDHTEPDDKDDWWPNGPALPAYPKVTPAKTGTLGWTRQLIFIKPVNATESAWMFLRDTTTGGEPTAWQFWTLSEKIGLPLAADKVAAFLEDAPGQAVVAASELPKSDRYTAYGQQGVDVEYFIASPEKTPRHTLRFGAVTPAGGNAPEFQDVLLLQNPGDGVYAVALYPRARDKAAPKFTAFAKGCGVVAESPYGKDYALLSTTPVKASSGDASFNTTAASIQVRGKDATLNLLAPGEIGYQKLLIASPAPVQATVTATEVILSRDTVTEPLTLTVTLPGKKATAYTMDSATLAIPLK
ncbi:MAG: hypothetical protein FWF84_05455 [Kiritimatiellaeota bacterium]|nr:hypothetical protein [Kiritimatiellota bacterium]